MLITISSPTASCFEKGFGGILSPVCQYMSRKKWYHISTSEVKFEMGRHPVYPKQYQKICSCQRGGCTPFGCGHAYHARTLLVTHKWQGTRDTGTQTHNKINKH